MGNAAGFAMLNQTPQKVGDFSGFNANAQFNQYKRQLTLGGGYNPYSAAPSNWMGVFRATKKPVKGYTPPAFPESLNVNMPYSSSSAKPGLALPDTTGDVLGSFGASWTNAISGQGGYINLANGISWGMERNFVAAKALADQVSGESSSKNNPGDVFGNIGSAVGKGLSGNFGGAIGDAINAFAGTVKAISEPISAGMEWFPNTVKNTNLNDRAGWYRDLVLGKPLPPQIELQPGATQPQLDAVHALNNHLVGSGLDAATAKAIVAGMIDLPESVKKQIEQNPNGDIAKYLDDAPEGRRFTYVPGHEYVDFVSTGLLYAIEIYAAGKVPGLLGGPRIGASPLSLGAEATLGRSASALAGRAVQTATQAAGASRVGKVLVTGVSAAAKIQKAALISGISYFPLSIMADTVLRTMGNKDGVAYLDKINRTALISDSPAVQLATAFTVNPITAASAASKGMLKMAYAPPILVGKALGIRLGKMYTHETALLDRMAQMYITDRAGAAELIGPEIGQPYKTKGDAFNNVLGLAADSMMTKLPEHELTVLNALGDDVRTAKLMTQQYLPRILDEFDSPSGLVARFKRDWSYRDLYGEYNPEIAKVIVPDFRDFMHKSMAAREVGNAVVGTVDVLNPAAQIEAKAMIEAAFADGRQGTLQDLNMLTVKHPSFGGNVTDLIAKGGPGGKPITKPRAPVDRSIFDEALRRATDAYDAQKVANPVRTATGVDPVLRPGVHLYDWAAAFDTTEDTIHAIIDGGKRTPAQDALIATFLRDKNLATGAELIGSKADDLYAKALKHLDTVSGPWVKRGGQVDLLEAEMGKAAEVESALRVRRAAGESIGNAEVAAAEAETAKWRTLLGDVRDPIVPAAEGVKSALKAEGSVMQAARRKVDAIGRAEEIQTVRDTLAPAQLLATEDLLHSVVLKQGTWRWAAYERVVGGPVFDAAVARYRTWQFEQRAYTRASVGVWDQQGNAYKAAEMSGSKGFARTLANRDQMALGQTVTNGEIADMLAASRTATKTVTEITPAMIEALGVADRAGFIARVGSLREAFDTALSGKSEYALGRTAAIKVSDWAVQRVMKGEVANLFRNPVADAAHSEAVLNLKAALDSDAFPAVRAIVEGDPLLRAQARLLAAREGLSATAGGVHGWSLGDFLKNPANTDSIRTLVTPVERRVPGVPLAETDLGAALLAGDESAPAVLKLKLDEVQNSIKEPLHNVPVEAVDALASAPRLSVKLTSDLNEAGIHWNALIPETLWAKSDAGTKALSAILNLNFHQPPQTIRGLLSTLKSIERGTADTMGMGPQLQAEAAALGERVAQSMIGDARKADLQFGVLGKSEFTNPATMSADHWAVIKKLLGDGNLVLTRDEQGLQYGLKGRPTGHKNAKGEYVPANPAIDMERMPAGFAEELLVGHFQPFSERIVNVRTRQAFARLFHIDNQQITFEARARFEKRLTEAGIPVQAAEKIWSKWRETAKESRVSQVKKDIEGNYFSRLSDSARYATERNIPNGELQKLAEEALTEFYANRGGIPAFATKINYSAEMRMAGSFTRRQLEKLPLDEPQRLYGLIAHNQFVTTQYYLFRFQLDARFHAMNKFEGPLLFTGRAGLKTAEIDQGMIGMTRDFVNRGQSAGDAMLDTGYPFSITRQEWIYRDLLKQQPDALRGIVKADPALVKKAVENAALRDPQIADMVAYMGNTPNEYLTILETYYNKVFSAADPEAVVGAELMKELLKNPEMEQVYGRMAEVNNKLLGDLRSVYYGNPARGQIERVLNNYLLYWPLSYQIKATKWLLNIMYGKIGGVQTGGLGAIALDRMQADHERMLVEDPEYALWFEKHPTLVFAAQMLIPISPGSLGVGMNPILRDVFFGGTKNVMEIGPVYSFTKFYPALLGELYQDLKDVPGIEPIAAAAMRTMGRKPPAAKPAPKGFAPLAP